MSTLYDFLVKLSGDLNLQREYGLDQKAVMTKAGLTEEEQAALLSADLDEIQEVAGSGGYVICKQVWVYKPK
jgi:Aromatic-ring-opening dioxygenase LigAB, LigA subunit